MSVQSFQNIKAVNFGTQGIAKVVLGTTQIWPAVVRNVRAGIDLGASNYAAREAEYMVNYDVDPNGANPLQTIYAEAGANILNVITVSGVGQAYDGGSMWISKDEWGGPYGITIDSNSGFHGDLQSRYGGLWKIPAATKPGDVLYVVVGQDPTGGAQFAAAKVVFLKVFITCKLANWWENQPDAATVTAGAVIVLRQDPTHKDVYKDAGYGIFGSSWDFGKPLQNPNKWTFSEAYFKGIKHTFNNTPSVSGDYILDTTGMDPGVYYIVVGPNSFGGLHQFDPQSKVLTLTVTN